MIRLTCAVAVAIAISSASFAGAGRREWNTIPQCMALGTSGGGTTFLCSGSLGAARASLVSGTLEAACSVNPGLSGTTAQCWVVDGGGVEKRCLAVDWVNAAVAAMTPDSMLSFTVTVGGGATSGDCESLTIEDNSIYQPLEL